MISQLLFYSFSSSVSFITHDATCFHHARACLPAILLPLSIALVPPLPLFPSRAPSFAPSLRLPLSTAGWAGLGWGCSYRRRSRSCACDAMGEAWWPLWRRAAAGAPPAAAPPPPPHPSPAQHEPPHSGLSGSCQARKRVACGATRCGVNTESGVLEKSPTRHTPYLQHAALSAVGLLGTEARSRQARKAVRHGSEEPAQRPRSEALCLGRLEG